MRIIGYGICGPGEAGRYMRSTLEEFKRLCDDTIILGNNITKAERDLIAEYGFKLFEDNREWGRYQWAIKEAFVNKQVRALKPDFLVCLDMDEVFCKHLTREWIEKAPLDAYHVFIVDLWNDPEHYKPQSCFWNVRLWRWNGDTKWKKKPVHCGLAPEWAYRYHRHAPFLLKHYGLMLKDDREKKIARYEKYDPNAQHLDRQYYDMLRADSAVVFDENKLCGKIELEVNTYEQGKPKTFMPPKKKRFAYVKNPHGLVVDIPENHLAETLKLGGFTFVEWVDDVEKEMEDLFEDVDVSEVVTTPTVPSENKLSDEIVLTPKKTRKTRTKKNG